MKTRNSATEAKGPQQGEPDKPIDPEWEVVIENESERAEQAANEAQSAVAAAVEATERAIAQAEQHRAASLSNFDKLVADTIEAQQKVMMEAQKAAQAAQPAYESPGT